MTQPDPGLRDNVGRDGSITELLQRWQDGDESAKNLVWSAVYGELHRRASAFLRSERPDDLMLTVRGLVNDTYGRLVDQRSGWRNREHFFATAARCMRRILLDHARARTAAKRGGDALMVTLDDEQRAEPAEGPDFLDLERALAKLAKTDPQLLELVELRYFAGIDAAELAQWFAVDKSTVNRRLERARAILQRDMVG